MINKQRKMSPIHKELIKICQPDTLDNDKGQLRAVFYLDDLAKKIESEKILMGDKVLEDIIRYAKQQRPKFQKDS